MDEEAIEANGPRTEHRMHRVFWGSNGLRAGWGALLFVVLYLFFAGLGSWVTWRSMLAVQSATVMPVKLMLILELVQGVPALLATAVMARIERKKTAAYGYQGTARVVRFFSGLLWGFGSLSALVLVLWKAHFLIFDGQSLHGAGPILKYAFAWGAGFLAVAIFEETLLRGYMQFTLTRGLGFWWGALLLSVLFGFSHSTNHGESSIGLFGAAAVGMMFCLSLWYTGSLWWALGCHAGWDWAQSYFYGTSDSGVVVRGHLFSAHPAGPLFWSGGATGPEGSVLALVVVACMAGGMVLWWGRRVQSPFRTSAWRPAGSRPPAL